MTKIGTNEACSTSYEYTFFKSLEISGGHPKAFIIEINIGLSIMQA